MKKLLYISGIWICILGLQNVQAQQLAQFSQYLHNPIVINPATSGVNQNLNVKLSYRNQWTGFNDAPRTYYISVDGALIRPQKGSSLRMSRPGYTEVKRGTKMINHGVGGYLISDTYGAFTNTSGYLTYALHLHLTNTIKLSLGVAGGMSGW
ncbi:MAG: PorP/SprF family type IX secretion system membrane protein, partial [Flavobacteriales bacterium]|nr:PorP/SprF family type IX secretion system membrane protein [Flavobacteriales bacterium]